MQRSVSADITVTVAEPARLAFLVAVAGGADDERLELALNGEAVDAVELTDAAGSRIHVVDAGPGTLVLSYAATVDGRRPAASVSELDLLEYLRPSRYCESDRLGPTAAAEFAGLDGAALLDAVSSWVGTRLSYVPGSSQPTDGAVQTLLARQGVCRDYAHLVIALLRALVDREGGSAVDARGARTPSATSAPSVLVGRPRRSVVDGVRELGLSRLRLAGRTSLLSPTGPLRHLDVVEADLGAVRAGASSSPWMKPITYSIAASPIARICSGEGSRG